MASEWQPAHLDSEVPALRVLTGAAERVAFHVIAVPGMVEGPAHELGEGHPPAAADLFVARAKMIGSFAIRGRPSSSASGRASVLLPDPGGPVTSTNRAAGLGPGAGSMVLHADQGYAVEPWPPVIISPAPACRRPPECVWS